MKSRQTYQKNYLVDSRLYLLDIKMTDIFHETDYTDQIL